MEEDTPVQEVQEQPTPSLAPAPPVTEPKTSKKKPILMVLVAILLIGAAGGGMWYYMNHKLDTQNKANQAHVATLQASLTSAQKQATSAQASTSTSKSSSSTPATSTIESKLSDCTTKANNEMPAFKGGYTFAYNETGDTSSGVVKYYVCGEGDINSTYVYYNNTWTLVYAGNGWTGDNPCMKYQSQNEQLYTLCKTALNVN